MKLIETISTQVKEIDKKEIKLLLDEINSTADKPAYQNKQIAHLFSYWGKYLPQHKQDLNCGGCRLAVLGFWNKVNEKWNSNG